MSHTRQPGAPPVVAPLVCHSPQGLASCAPSSAQGTGLGAGSGAGHELLRSEGKSWREGTPVGRPLRETRPGAPPPPVYRDLPFPCVATPPCLTSQAHPPLSLSLHCHCPAATCAGHPRDRPDVSLLAPPQLFTRGSGCCCWWWCLWAPSPLLFTRGRACLW